MWLEATGETIAACVRAAAVSEEEAVGAMVRAICVSGLYGGSGIPVDADMRPLHPCLIWLDRRAGEQVDWVRRTIILIA